MPNYFFDCDTKPDNEIHRPGLIVRTERGWAGHFCNATKCGFRRNTLLEYGEKRIIISTVGNQIDFDAPFGCTEPIKIGVDHYYETAAFMAVWDEPYWEIDVTKPVRFKSPWKLTECERETDLEANKRHEQVVEELSRRLLYEDPNITVTPT